MSAQFPYAGKSFTIEMDNGLKVKNSYHTDKDVITVEFLNGDLNGTVMGVCSDYP